MRNRSCLILKIRDLAESSRVTRATCKEKTALGHAVKVAGTVPTPSYGGLGQLNGTVPLERD